MRWVLLFILLFATSIYADVPWIPNVRVSTDVPWDTLNQGESCFDVYGDSIFSICNTAERADVPIAPYAYSFNEGQTFTQTPFTDNATGIIWHTDPLISVDDSGHVHMLIQFSATLMNHYFSRDGGLTWEDTSQINSILGVDKPWWVINENEIYVAWQQVDGPEGIWFAKSTDYGETFTDSMIWEGWERRGITALCMDENENLHLALVCWYSDSVYYRKSTDKGKTWSPEIPLSDWYYSASYGDRAPINSITARGNVVFVTWVDTRNGAWDIMGVRSTDGGATWDSPFVVNDITDGGQCKGWAHFDDYGGLHVTYYHTPDWPTDINSLFSLRYQYSPDSGATFNPGIRASDTSFISQADFMGEYHICVSDSLYLYAIWTDGRNGDDNDLYFSKALLSELSVGVPVVSIFGYEWMDYEGDGHADPGDTLSLTISLLNSGKSASTVDVNLSTNDPFITLIDSISNYGEILNDSIKDNSGDPFILYVDESTILHKCTLNVDIVADSQYSSYPISIVIGGIPPILVIDDDGGDSYETYFTQSLDRIDELYDIKYSEDSVTSSLLLDYQALVWLTGDNPSPVDSGDVLALKDYLDSGGNLFITGQDVEGCADNSFYHNYLHATLVEDSTSALTVFGIGGDPIGDGLFFFIKGSPGADNQLTPSIISPIGGADSIFNYGIGGYCGVKYEDTCKVVHLSFGFEAIASLSTADTIMARIMNWFDISAGIEEAPGQEVFFISQGYPNPFLDRTKIEYTLPKISDVNIAVYNILGAKVSTLLNKRQNPGRYTMTWDGRDDSGDKLPSGFYFLRLEAGEYKGTRKLLLIK